MTQNFLFTAWEGGGNVPPTMEAVRRLLARGHDVRVLADDSMRREVEMAGAAFIAWRRAPNRPDLTNASILLRDYEAEGPGGDLIYLLDHFAIGRAADYAADTIDELRRVPADAVVSSELLFGPMIAAEATGTRLVLLGANLCLPILVPGGPKMGPGMMPPVTPEEHAQADGIRNWVADVMARQLPALNAARASVGLAPMTRATDQAAIADRILLAVSRAFDFPGGNLPPAARYVGPLLEQPYWVGTWTSPWSESDKRPLVLMAFSTTFQDQASVVQAVLDAVAPLAVRVLATLGPALEHIPLRLPANARTVVAAPHDIVMREAALVVTHAGHGTVMRALAHGLPMLCLPMGRDQDDNAVRVVARGAGLRLPRESKPTAIAAAITWLLDDPAFAAAAACLGRAIAASEPENALVDALEESALAPPLHVS